MSCLQSVSTTHFESSAMIIYADEAGWSCFLGMRDFRFDHRKLSYNIFLFLENDDSYNQYLTGRKFSLEFKFRYFANSKFAKYYFR